MSAIELAWSEAAVDDLRVLRQTLGRDSVPHADRTRDRIFESIARAAAFPRLGRVVAEVADESVRELLLRTLRVIYQIADGRIIVLGLVEGGRAIERRESRRWEV